jgi:hypothetical protein
MQIPIDTRPRITKADIANQYVMRYFVQMITNKRIYEVDLAQYNFFSKMSYYTAIQMPWIISGDAYTKVVGGQVITGALDKNINIINYYDQRIKGLKQILSNPLQYFEGTISIAQPLVSTGTAVTTVGDTETTEEESTLATSITVLPTSLTFNYQIGSTTPNSQSISVTADGTLDNLYIMSSSSWVSASLSSTTAPATVWVTPIVTGLYSGSYSSTVTVDSTQTGISSVEVGVTLNVNYSSSILFAYEPGMSLTPATFTRATSASYNELVS